MVDSQFLSIWKNWVFLKKFLASNLFSTFYNYNFLKFRWKTIWEASNSERNCNCETPPNRPYIELHAPASSFLRDEQLAQDKLY